MSKEDISEIMQELKDLKHILNGNGKPGLVARVVNLETTSKALGSWITWFFRLFVALALGAIIKKIYGV